MMTSHISDPSGAVSNVERILIAGSLLDSNSTRSLVVKVMGDAKERYKIPGDNRLSDPNRLLENYSLHKRGLN
jgi:hypothetical protein